MENKVFAVEDAGHEAGAIVYWRLSGMVDPDTLSASWERGGLDLADLPDLPAPTTALSRAVKPLQKGRTLVRPLADRAGYAIVNEQAKGDNLDYHPELRVRLDAVSRLVFAPEDHRLVPTVKASYSLALTELDGSDIAPWLVAMLSKRCDAVPLRDRGGVYYVPPAKVATWDAISEALRAASSHRLFKIPAMSSQDVLDAVLDAVEREAREETEAMTAEIVERADGGKGVERIGKARLARCDAIEQKVARYETLLGQRLESVRERLGELRETLSEGILIDSADAAEE